MAWGIPLQRPQWVSCLTLYRKSETAVSFREILPHGVRCGPYKQALHFSL